MSIRARRSSLIVLQFFDLVKELSDETNRDEKYCGTPPLRWYTSSVRNNTIVPKNKRMFHVSIMWFIFNLQRERREIC